MTNNIRNVVIISHVDHGKTTLVDAFLRQSKIKLKKGIGDSLIMDSNDLEKERGITIFSKNASVRWHNTKINIIDTPGHADFGGEVERVLKMADGCLLLIDAQEGPMPQTRFVLKKALEMKLKIIVVINKIDKKDARVSYALDKTLDLFLELGADEETIDFPIIFASAKEGKAGLTNDLAKMTDISPVFEMILDKIPAPSGSIKKPLQIMITTLSSDPHKGPIAIGRIFNGKIRNNQEVSQIKKDQSFNKCKVTSLMTFEGLDRVEVQEALAGDMVAVTGLPDPKIGQTISEAENPVSLPPLDIEQPTIKATFLVNNSPFAGLEGRFTTSREVGKRLYKELETDMALQVKDDKKGWIVAGRGELHLTILIERMRREGYEFQVAKPQVIDKEVNGEILTPYEKVFIEAPEKYLGIIMQKLGARRGELQDMKSEKGLVYLEFVISTKGFFGYRNEFISDTQGLGIMNALFFNYRKDNGYLPKREHGSLVAFETGVTNVYGLTNIQHRGTLFFGPGVSVYKGQAVGQNNRDDNILVNVCKAKHLSNMRSKGEGVTEYLKTPKTMDLEAAFEYIADDELVEVTPKNIRIRKVVLDKVEERRRKSQGIYPS